MSLVCPQYYTIVCSISKLPAVGHLEQEGLGGGEEDGSSRAKTFLLLPEKETHSSGEIVG